MNVMNSNLSAGAEEIISNVRAVLPELAAAATQTDKEGLVPAEILLKLEKAGAFRAAVPAKFGGPGLTMSEVAGLIEDVAYADASAAWHMMVAAGAQVITARLPLESLEEMYSNGPDTFCKGAAAPKAVAIPVEGGYRLTGQWPLASGSRDFEWANLGFFVKGEKGLRMDPELKRPDMRICIVPAKDVEVIRTWDSVGMRGSRSDDMKVVDLFVPEEKTASLFGASKVDDPVLGMRMPFGTGPHHSAVVIGVLRAAVDHMANEALTRKPAFNPTTIMKDEPVFRSKFGEIVSRIDSLRHMHQNAINLVSSIGNSRPVSPIEAGQLGATQTFVHHEATGIMDQIMALSGSGGLYMSNPQQRRWRDVRAAAAHQAANIGHYASYAGALLDKAAADAEAASA